MRIFEQDSVNIQKPQSGRTSETSGSKARFIAPGVASGGEDHVDVSAQSQLQSLAAAVGEGPRTDRVEELRALFNSGNYEVDVHALSGAILGEMLHGG